MSKYIQEKIPSHINLYSGGTFDYKNMDNEAICLDDIAHALSQICRFTGHTRYKFYSVGEHSLLCLTIAKRLKMSKRMQFLALMHDATEAYVNDLNRPLKQDLSTYKEIEDKIGELIWGKFKFDVTQEEYDLLKSIDDLAIAMEFHTVMLDKEKGYQLLQKNKLHPDFTVVDFFSVTRLLSRESTMQMIKTKFFNSAVDLIEELELDLPISLKVGSSLDE